MPPVCVRVPPAFAQHHSARVHIYARIIDKGEGSSSSSDVVAIGAFFKGEGGQLFRAEESREGEQRAT